MRRYAERVQLIGGRRGGARALIGAAAAIGLSASVASAAPPRAVPSADLSGFAAGAPERRLSQLELGGPPTPRPRPPLGARDRACPVAACAARYRTFRASDCTFQPFDGPRKRCVMEGAAPPAPASSLAVAPVPAPTPAPAAAPPRASASVSSAAKTLTNWLDLAVIGAFCLFCLTALVRLWRGPAPEERGL